VGADEVVDFFDEIGGGIERAATDGALSDEGEEAFDLVEPGGIGGREVNVPARAACGEKSARILTSFKRSPSALRWIAMTSQPA
jgi:hypothetical protein